MARRLSPHNGTRQRLLERIAHDEVSSEAKPFLGPETAASIQYDLLDEVIPNEFSRNLIREFYKGKAVSTVLEAVNSAANPATAIEVLAIDAYKNLFTEEDELPMNFVLLGSDDVGVDERGNTLIYRNRHTEGLDCLQPGCPSGYESQFAVEGAACLLETDRFKYDRF